MDQYQKQLGGKLKIVNAFSRMQGQEKVYVQDRVDEQGAEVLQLLNEGRASFYICGRTSMSKEVGKRVARLACGKYVW